MTPGVKPVIPPTTMPVTMMNPAVAPIVSTVAQVPAEIAPPVNLPVKQWLGPPVNKAGCIVPVSGALASARRDPRLARLVAAPTTPVAPQPIAPNVFDIKPLGRVTKRKNFITIEVSPDAPPVLHPRDPRRRDPRLNKRDDRQWRPPQQRPERQPESYSILERLLEVKSIAKLPPIPKIQREREPDEEQAVVLKKKKDTRDERKKKKVKDSGSNSSSPEKKARSLKHSEAKEKEVPKDTKDKQKETPKEQRDKRRRERRLETEPEAPAPVPEEDVFKELKNYRKDRCYMCRNRGKSGSPERPAADANKEAEASSVNDVVVENKDIDFRVLHRAVAETKAAPVAQKRSSTELLDGKPKKSKIDKLDVLFGNEDVDLRQLPQVEELTAPPPPSLDLTYTEAIPAEDDKETSPETSTKKDWQDVKEKDEDNRKTPLKLDLVRAKLLRNINVNDLFAKLVATGIVQVPNEPKKKEKAEQKTEDVMKPKPKEDKNIIHRADLLKPETLRV
ncbi:unnamed protein product [Diatraea saccharalis]|nr:unnamed protein product [Diatraea saccharalis]